MVTKTRYLVTQSYYIWANSDEAVRQIADSKAKKEREYNDNRCEVIKIEDAPFGNIGKHRRVDNV